MHEKTANMTTTKPQRQRSVLVINPNTTHAMTKALEPLIESLKIDGVSSYL